MQLHHCVIAWPRLGQTTVIKNVNQSPEVLDFILVENDHFWGGFQCKRPPNRRVVKKQSHAKLWDVDLKWNAWKWMELQGFKGNKNEWSEHNPYRLNSTQTLEFPLFSMDFTPIGFPQFCMGLFFNYPQIMHWKPPHACDGFVAIPEEPWREKIEKYREIAHFGVSEVWKCSFWCRTTKPDQNLTKYERDLPKSTLAVRMDR